MLTFWQLQSVSCQGKGGIIMINETLNQLNKALADQMELFQIRARLLRIRQQLSPFSSEINLVNTAILDYESKIRDIAFRTIKNQPLL